MEDALFLRHYITLTHPSPSTQPQHPSSFSPNMGSCRSAPPQLWCLAAVAHSSVFVWLVNILFVFLSKRSLTAQPTMQTGLGSGLQTDAIEHEKMYLLDLHWRSSMFVQDFRHRSSRNTPKHLVPIWHFWKKIYFFPQWIIYLLSY